MWLVAVLWRMDNCPMYGQGAQWPQARASILLSTSDRKRSSQLISFILIIPTHLAAQHLQWHCAVSGGNWVWAGNQFHLTTVIKCPEDGNELMSCWYSRLLSVVCTVYRHPVYWVTELTINLYLLLFHCPQTDLLFFLHQIVSLSTGRQSSYFYRDPSAAKVCSL